MSKPKQAVPEQEAIIMSDSKDNAINPQTDNNQNDNGSAAPAPAAASADQPTKEQSTKPNNADEILAQVRRELEMERQRNVELKQKLSLAEAAKTAHVQPQGTRAAVVQGEIARRKAVEVCGGEARFNQMSFEQRLAAVNVTGVTQDEIDKAREVFVRGNSAEASRVMKASPVLYSRLKAISRELN